MKIYRNTRRAIVRWTIILICLGSAWTQSQDAIQLTLEDADIRDLVRWASEHTGKNIILHPDVKGNVTVLAGEPMQSEEAYNVFLSVLEVHGYAVIETPESLKILPAPLANAASGSVDEPGHAEDVVVKIVRAHNMPVEQLVNVLKPLVPKEALLSAYPDSNMLVISDRARNIERISNIISRVDTAEVVDIEVVELDYAGAEDIRRVVMELMPDIVNRASEGARGFKMTADQRSNSILMSGDPRVLEQIRGLIRRLDRPQAGEGNTQVIFVNYASAASLVPVLQSLSGDYQQRADVDKGQPDVDVQIQVNDEMNALVITAPPSLLVNMKNVIGQLDVRRAQVLVEALIVEVNEDALRQLGVEWRTNVPSDGVFAGFSSVPTAIGTPTPPSLGLGLTLGFFSSDQLRAVIRALEGDSSANILSTPTIVALDNEEAHILVGANVPFITGQSTGPSSSTENPFQTIERHDIGITLNILPRINNDDSITLEVQQTVETIVPQANNAAGIITNKRNIETKVLIEDDEVLVLGGLIDDKVTEVINRVPVLGHIPVLGRLFSSSSTQVTKQNLMVFIHPRILRSHSQKDIATRHYYENFRALQKEQIEERHVFSVPKGSLPILPDLDEEDRGLLITPSGIDDSGEDTPE